MIRIHNVPLYWGVETNAADRSFLTRSTLHEILPPFRQSNKAIRIRLSPWHWLHIGIYHYDAIAGRWGLEADPSEIASWGRKNNVEEDFDSDWDADLQERVTVRPVQQSGPDRPAGSVDDEVGGAVSWPEPFRDGPGVGSRSA